MRSAKWHPLRLNSKGCSNGQIQRHDPRGNRRMKAHNDNELQNRSSR
jgi:hypothetical protein